MKGYVSCSLPTSFLLTLRTVHLLDSLHHFKLSTNKPSALSWLPRSSWVTIGKGRICKRKSAAVASSWAVLHANNIMCKLLSSVELIRLPHQKALILALALMKRCYGLLLVRYHLRNICIDATHATKQLGQTWIGSLLMQKTFLDIIQTLRVAVKTESTPRNSGVRSYLMEGCWLHRMWCALVDSQVLDLRSRGTEVVWRMQDLTQRLICEWTEDEFVKTFR